MDELLLREQLPFALGDTDFSRLGKLYRGKVRDTYLSNDRLIIITTDRISAFDHVLGTIPFKGEILNRTAAFWFEKTRDIVPNHVLDIPDPNVMVVRACSSLPIEFVVRGYMTGSLWRDYQSGKSGVYGVEFPKGMKKDEKFPSPIITPTTKAEIGKHDEAISRQEILAKNLIEKPVLDKAYEYSLALFARGQEWAAKRGLILVDTKYEFGVCPRTNELLVIDEIHTMDSSRFWEGNEYAARFAKGEDQRMLDKENVRQWLIRERGFSGSGEPPALTEEVRIQASRIYAAAFERITGQTFVSQKGNPVSRIEENLKAKGY